MDQCGGSDEPGVLAEHGRDDPYALGELKTGVAVERRPQRREEKIADLRHAAADRHHLDVAERLRRRDRDPERSTGPGERRDRHLLAEPCVRTEIPAAAAAHQGPWTIATSGLLAKDGMLALDDLMRSSKKMGPHLFECSGNGNPSNFGLMSVAEWEGVPLAEVVARLKPSKEATGVLVSGFDHIGQVSQRSIVGASWVLPLSSLDQLGAFLAVRMNGVPVPADHGKPVRLGVPGWYGCAWIKWVNEMRLVGPEEPATTQMVEFAGRTHQSEPHKLAKDFTPADIQTAATPVRVEKRRTASGLEYRIVGIVWGGTKPVDRLAIRFSKAEPRTQGSGISAQGPRPQSDFVPFSICPAPKTPAMWSLWEYRWRPNAPGTYDIALKVADASVPQRRLESGYYMRQVKIEEV